MECIDYRRHELECSHKPHKWRWRTADGCSGSTCGEGDAPVCKLTGWTDVEELTSIDRDGIPHDKSRWTNGDRLGDLIRRLTRDRD